MARWKEDLERQAQLIIRGDTIVPSHRRSRQSIRYVIHSPIGTALPYHSIRIHLVIKRRILFAVFGSSRIHLFTWSNFIIRTHQCTHIHIRSLSLFLSRLQTVKLRCQYIQVCAFGEQKNFTQNLSVFGFCLQFFIYFHHHHHHCGRYQFSILLCSPFFFRFICWHFGIIPNE